MAATTDPKVTMKSLYLFRHAKAEPARPGVKDFDRPLAAAGMAAARAIGRHMAARGLRPALVLCSPALRTRDTWQCLQDHMGLAREAVKVEFDFGLYEADARDILAKLRQIPRSVSSVMVVGHNPGVGELANDLVDRPGPDAMEPMARMRQKFPTAALAAFTVPADTWGLLTPRSCRLDLFIRPADLV